LHFDEMMTMSTLY